MDMGDQDRKRGRNLGKRSLLIVSSIIGVFLAGLFVLDAAAMTVVLLGFFLGLLAILALSQPADYKFLWRIFSIGFVARLSVAAFSFFFSLARGGNGFLLQEDGVDASCNGWAIATLWRMELTNWREVVRSVCMSTRLGFYHYWNAVVYYFTGYNPLVMFFINCLVGALTIILIYLIAKKIFLNEKIAKISALLYTFWPSTFLWSTMNSKESLIVFFTCLAIWSFVNIREKFNIGQLLLMLLSILILGNLRRLAFILVVFAIFSSLLIYKKKLLLRPTITVLILMAILISLNLERFSALKQKLYGYALGGSSFFGMAHYTHNVRAKLAEHGSGFLTNIDISTPARTLLYLPYGLSYAMFAPFLWQLSSATELMAAPEILVWYILLPFVVYGFLLSLKYKWKEVSIIIIFAVLMLFTLALFEGNVGTLFRHRASLIPFCLILAARGFIQEDKEKQSA